MESPQKHRDRISGELSEPLDEHATFQLGINYGMRHAFTHGQPLTRAYYNDHILHVPYGIYFIPPSYEEYLELYDRYSEACRVRAAAGLSDREAAETVRSRIEMEKEKDEAILKELGIDDRFRGAFTHGGPLTRSDYEFTYASGDQTLPEGIPSYEEYVSSYYYGETGVGPESREEYMKRYVFVAPRYEEYLKLYKKYSEARR